MYYRMPRGGDAKLVAYDAFFYPLDGVQDWNRAYGPRGFFQYQCVVPEGAPGREALSEVLARIAASGQGSFLSVLKRFGSMASAGMMSFPRPGYTLALDFPHRRPRTLALLAELDAAVIAPCGRAVPPHDSRRSASSFSTFYPP